MGGIKKSAVSNAEAKAVLWRRGVIDWLLKPCQKAMLRAVLGSTRFKYVIKCARRLGKTYFLCFFSILTCLLKPGAQVRYAAPTAKALRKVIRPIMNKILRSCPEEMRPIFKSAEGMYLFPNSSEIHLAGVNNGRADDLRGPACDLFIIDEARDVDELEYLVSDVAMPQFLDPDGLVVKGRRLIVASSPAATPDHEFTQMAKEAEVGGYYSHYTIFDGGYPPEVIRMFLEEDGIPAEDVNRMIAGEYADIQSTTVRREYLAEDIIDTENALVPEWKPALHERAFDPAADPYYIFWHKYEAMDIGVELDKTVCLFAYYNFKESRLYILDEIDISGVRTTTELIEKRILEKQNELKWDDTTYQVYRRISDNSHPLLNNDLSARPAGLAFVKTDKEKLHEMIGEVRVWVKQNRIVAHPRCKQVIGCLSMGIWDKHRKMFARSKVFGHYDALAALIYLVRNVDQYSNPLPEYTWNPDGWPVAGKKETLSPMGEGMRGLFSTLK